MLRSGKNLIVKILTGIFLFGILFSLDGIAQIIYLLKIPIISSGYGIRIFAITLFSGALLSGFGLTDFLNINNKKKVLFSLIYIGVVALIFIVSLEFRFTPFVHLKFPMMILFVFTVFMGLYYLFIRRFPKMAAVAFVVGIILCTYFDLFRLGYRFLTFSNSKFLYPDTRVVAFVKDASKKSLDRVYGLAEPELPTYLGVYSLETYNPLYPIRTARLLQLLNGKNPNILPVNKFILDKTRSLKRVLDVTGTSLIVVGKGENPATQYFLTSDFEKNMTKIYSDDLFEVYKNTTAYPRFNLYFHAKTGLSDNVIMDDIRNGITDLRGTLLLENTLSVPLEEGTGSALLIHSTVNSQEFKIISSTQGLFYISDAYFPGWHAFVNQKEVNIYRTNYNFRSVLIPKGQSDVVFLYQPSNWYWIIGISFCSFVALVFMSLFL